jgi:uncharacterized membrane protein (UPF0127 family)
MNTPPAPPPQQLPIEAQWCLKATTLRPVVTSGPCIELEVARTQQQQSWGLMGRPPLAPLRGMWFPYDQPQVVKFWMHRTPSPLDMLFIRDKRVIAIEANTTPCPRLPCRSYGPDEPADGVVELAAGEASRLGLQVGSAAVIRPFKPQPAARPAAPARD